MCVLVVEDDARVADFLVRGLKAEGYGIDLAKTGSEAVDRALHNDYGLIILDLMLPEMHGHEVCQTLRTANVLTPVLMLTAMDTLEDKVKGLRLGADDYMTKPFAFDELLARMEALMRRRGNFEQKPTTLQIGDLSFDRDSLNVKREDTVIDLTAKELAILELLMSAPGKVFSREKILSNVWGISVDPLTNIVDVYIGKLRKKIDSGDRTPMLKTVRGRGYSIAENGA